jgi:hypothetical protein
MTARKPRRVRTKPPHREPDVPVNSPADFTDPESVRVLDAIADALLGHLAVQQAREDHLEWFSRDRGQG